MCNCNTRRKMDKLNRVQILDEVDYISFCTNTLGKDRNPMFSLQLWLNNTAGWVL